MNTRRLFFKRILPLMMVAVMAFTSVPANIISRVTGSNAADMATVSAAEDYGLCDNIQDGTILHCFDWKYSDIEAELPNIAKAGFTSVQTSPAQRDDQTPGDKDRYIWFMLYQPQGFAIATNPLGTKAELESLCKKAEEYGIKVVVDVVANHTRGMGGENGDIDANLKKREFFRYGNTDSDNMSGSDWENRGLVYSCNIGMRDLVSENAELQGIISGYIDELKSIGVDGIRWDAAKHIQLPSEGSEFWKKVTSQGLYHYGEILEGPDDRKSGNEGLMKEYTNYLSVTDNGYGSNLTGNFRDGKVISENGKWVNKNAGITADKLVYWAESHDTYANEENKGGWTKFINQNVIDRAYAIAGSRKGATALYFSRPSETEKESIKAGVKGSTHFTSPEVAEVNHLHNACVGEKEYYVGDTNNNVAAVCRESGAVVVLGSGGNRTVTVANGGGTVKPGEYEDQVSGGKWTVTSSTMTGPVGDKGIAVFYNAKPIEKTPVPTISKEGGNFNDTLTLTIGLKDAISGTYKIGDGAAETYTSSKQITIGSDMSYGDSVIITLTATDGTKTETRTYTFNKVEQTGNVVYLSLPSGWNKPVYCYAFIHGVTPVVENAEWPGAEMTLDEASGYYKYEIPEDITTPEVILHDNTDANRTSPDQQPGKVVEGSWLYKDGSWSEYSSPRPQPEKGTVTVKYVDESGKEIAASKKLTGDVGSSYETSAAAVNGYTLKTTPSNASGKYTKEAITVTYTYTKNGGDETPTVTSSLAEGSVFKTETAKITLTLQNAESGTYSVDDGPVKTFTGSKEVVIGQGKVADSTVTVKATATSGKETKNYTFTYKKQFVKTVDETLKDLQAAKAGNAFASDYYKVNPSGTGSEKTIKSASDWTAKELICQGVANDDSNVFKGPHELPVYDEYALYAAYDDTNLYIGWQYVNMRDVVAPDERDASTGQSKPYIAPIPQVLALDLGSSKGAYGNGDMVAGTKDKKVWNIDIDYKTNVNALVCFSSKHDGEPSLFTTDSDGKFSYDKEYCKGFEDLGISYEYEDGLFAGITSLYGIKKNGKTGYETDMLLSNSSEWEDLSSGHNKDLDTFYTITIPYTALNISKDYLKNNGIGVMHISTFGASGVACIPVDESMYDVAKEAYSQDDSSTREKEDCDIITASLARIGKGGSPNPNPDPDPDPDPTPDSLELNFGADRSSPQTAATGLSLKGIAKGGTAPYTYKFYVKDELVGEKSGSGEVSVDWIPAAGNNQIIECLVEDSKGNKKRSAKFYTIESKVEDCKHSKTIVQGDKEATCTEDGHEGNTVCIECGGVIVKGNVIPAKGHTWVSGVCTVCGEKQPTDCKHSNTKVQGAKEATCTEDGHEGNTVCTDCGEVIVQGKVILAKGHTWVSGVCTVCGEKQPTDCKHSNKKVRGAKEATCTEAGYTGDTVCVDCSELIATGTVISAKGHNWSSGVCTVCGAKQDDATIDVTVVDADIVYDGKAKTPQVIVKAGKKLLTKDVDYTVSYKNNTNAGEALVVVTGKGDYTGTVEKSFIIAKATGPASGIPGTEKNAPKSAEKVSDIDLPSGWKWSDEDAGKKLETGASVTATAVYEGTDKNNYETVRVSVKITKSDCEHPYSKIKLKNEKAATCTEKGYTGDKYCEDCQLTVENGTETKALGHLWDEGNITKEPTATVEGEMTYKCSRCTATKTEVIPAVCRHISSEVKGKKAATCTENGYSGDSCCKECGEILEKGTDIPATGHSWDTGRITKQPTATEKGVKTYTCTKCSETKTEDIAPIGECRHTNKELRNEKAATCTENGYTGDRCCKDCGTVVESGRVIQALGHSWDNGQITKAPTATQKGIRTYTCTRCRNTRTEEIPATGGNDTSINYMPVITVPGNVEKGTSVEDTATNSVYTVTGNGAVSKTVKYVVTGSEKDTLVVPNAVSINGDTYKVTAVASDAFKGNDKVKKIIVGDNVKTIGANAFSNCENLSEVTLGKNVITIGANAFSNCKKMTKVTLGKSVTTIGKNAFGGCTRLSKVTLPSKLSKIEEKAFYKCTSLKSITIPSKVKKIGKNAFNGCKNLKKITIKTTKLTKKNVGSNAFKGINSKATIKVPKKKLASYKKILRARGVGSKAKIKK